MLNANQQAWVDALRSGEFKQGKYRLQDGDCYCCLGVLCVVAEKHGVEVNKHPNNQLVGLSLTGQPAVRGWAGLDHPFGRMLLKSGEEAHLTKFNDGSSYLGSKTFAEIADIIEQNAESLFTQNVPN